MFLRIDTDLFVNIDNILTYKLYDEGESYKLVINGNDKSPIIVFYLKGNPNDMKILGEVVSKFREITINPDMSIFQSQPEEGYGVDVPACGNTTPEEIMGEFDQVVEDPIVDEGRHIKEVIEEPHSLADDYERVDEEQISIFDYDDDGEII